MVEYVPLDIAMKRLKRRTQIHTYVECNYKHGRMLYKIKDINKEALKRIYRFLDEEKEWMNRLKDKIKEIYIKIIMDDYEYLIFIHLYLDDLNLKEFFNIFDENKLKNTLIEMFDLGEFRKKAYYFDISISTNKKSLEISYHYDWENERIIYSVKVIKKNEYRLETDYYYMKNLLKDLLGRDKIKDAKLHKIIIKRRLAYDELDP